MLSTQGVVLLVTVLVAELALTHGFWYYGSSSANSNTAKKMPPGPPPPGMGMGMQGYTLRSEAYGPWPVPPQYQADTPNTGHLTVALPVAVPLQPQMAQMAPAPAALQGTLHNVQLVPCLCPISKDFKDYDPMASQMQQQASLQPSPTYSHQQTSSSNNP